MRLWLALLLSLIVSPALAANQITDIACETTATTGTGTINLAGAKSGGYISFADAGVTSGNTVPYSIVTGTGASRKLETGFGTFTNAATDTLSRTANWSSDSPFAGAELNLSGTSTVCIGPIAGLYTDAAVIDEIAADGLLTASEGTAAFLEDDTDLGDFTCVAGVCGVDANAIALGTDTTGNYALGDSEGGAATTGDSATAFFSSGTIEDARIDGSAEVDEVLNSDLTDFTCSAGVCNLDADVVTPTELAEAGNYDFTGTVTLDSDALQLDDTNASHQLILTPGSDLSTDRVLTLTTGDAARTLTLSDNATLNDADYGDITTSSDFTVWNLDADVVTQTEVGDDAIGINELDLVDGDTPSNGDCLTYDTGAGGSIEAIACPGGGGISNVVEDLTPQLGGFLDWNGQTMRDALLTDTLVLDLGEDELKLTNDTADVDGVEIIAHHDSASPALDDVPFSLSVIAGADDESVGSLDYRLIDGGTGSEDGNWEFWADVGGAAAKLISIGDGVIIGSGTTLPGAGNLAFADGLGIDNAEGTAMLGFQNDAGGGIIDVYDDMNPDTDAAYDLGTASLGWRDIYVTSDVEFNGATDTTLTAPSAGNLSIEGSIIKKVGKETIWVGAGAMVPNVTSGAAPGTYDSGSNDLTVMTLDFDTGATEERADFQIAMPKSWDEGTLTFVPISVCTGCSASQTIQYELACVAVSHDDTLNATMGTAQTSSVTVTATNDSQVGAESSAITCAGTPAESDLVAFRISRDTSVDNGAGDARLIGVKVFWTSNAANDT